MITCKECGAECSQGNALSYHLRKHGMKYDDYIVKHDFNGVWPVCQNDKCKKRLKRKNGGFCKFCSKSCGSSGMNNGMFGLKGDKSPNKGKVRTTEHRAKYSIAAKKRWVDSRDSYETTFQSDEYKEMQRQAQILSYETKPEQKEKRVASMNRFWAADTDETRLARKNATDHAIKLLNEGKIGPQAPFKTQWMTNPFTGEEEYMHSSWEVMFLEKCIQKRYPVTKFHDIKIPYVDADGVDRTYIPDFIALEEKVVFELKGRMTDNDHIKIKALYDWTRENGYEMVLIKDVSDL